MNSRHPLTSRRLRALLVFFTTVATLFGALFATVRAQSITPDAPDPDAVALTLSATTSSGIPNVAYLGGQITYTLRITNTGNNTLNDVLLIDDLPRDTFDNYQCSDCTYITETQSFPDPLGGTITVTITRRIRWNINTLAPGQVVSKTFTAKVVGQPDGAEFTNRAFAYYSVNGIPDTQNSNDSVVSSRVQLPQDGNLAVSSAATWFSEDFGGTLSQDWGDFDEDGDLDLLLGSSLATTIYRNDDGELNRYWTTERTAYGVRWLDIGAENLSFVAVGASVDGTAVTTGTNVIYTYNPNATNAATRFLEVDTFRSDLQLIRVQPGDVNDDGFVDLVATTNAINAECPTQLFLHSEDSTAPYDDFGSVCASNDASAAIALGDADNDGDLDLASGRFASQDATLLFNDHINATAVMTGVIFTDTNSASIETGLSFLPYDFSWGDYNNDGLLDLAAAYPLEREARVYRNLGGTFAEPIVIRTGIFRTPLSVDWGDFDNDGVLELAVADSIPRIYKISTAGVVTQLAALTPNAIPLGTQIWSIRGIDQDNDNDLDISLASRDGPSQIFTVFAPLLDTEMTAVDSTSASSVAWGDADSDGTQDLLLGAGPPSTSGFGTRLYYNQGGYFQSSQSDQITGFGPHIVAFGDVNKDGQLDIALGTTAQTQIYLAEQLTSPAWVSPNANANNALAWGDFDHDGDLDLLVGSAQASLIYRKQGNLLDNTPIWRSEITGDDTRAVAWADFDGDKLLDFVIGNNGQPNRLYRNIERDEFELVEWNPTPVATRALAWGDYDRDGDMDLAVADYNGSVLIYENLTIDTINPQPTLSDTPFALPNSNHRATALAWGDWDNDGDLDLAVGNDGFHVQVYANQTRNPEIPNFAWVWASENSTYKATGVAWGDIDNDGDLDLATSQSGSDANGVFFNGYITPSHLRNFQTTIPLPDNSSYVQVERPGQTDDAFFHSAPEILSGPAQPSVPIRYRVYDPDGSRDPTVPNPNGDGILRTLFEYSLDGGGTWETATPTSETVLITTTSRLGVEGLFIWDAQEDEAISDQALFRVRVIPVARTGSRPRGAAVGVSAPFRVRGTTCEWPQTATMTMSPTNPLPGAPVRFTGAIAAGTGVMSYTWDFGDGTSAQGQMVTHTYARQDFFDVELTVSGPPCPLNYPAYAQATIQVGDPILGPDTFLPLIGRNNEAGDISAPTEPQTWPEETTKIPPSYFRPTLPTIEPQTAVMAVENLCLAPSQISNSPIGISNQPVINNDGSRIAFWSTGDLAPTDTENNLDGNIEIFLWRRDTPATPFYQVTASPGTILGGLNIAPSINAAGDRIAFFSDRHLGSDNEDGTFEIFVASIGTTGEITLTQVTDELRTSSILPSISANGRRVAYISDEEGSPEVFVADLNANGTVNALNRVTRLPGTTNDQPVISGNGQVIAFISNANISNGNPDGNGEVFIARNTSGATWVVQQVTFTGAGAFNSDVDLNGNGSELAFISTGEFTSNPEGNAELFVATLGSSITITQITSSADVTNERPTMSDDGLRIAFISNANSNGTASEQKRVFLYDDILNSYGEVSNQSNSNSGEAMLNGAGDRITYVANNAGDREVYRLDCFVADIGISSAVAPDPLVPGAPLTYTFTIRNAGPNEAVTTTTSITLPVEVLSLTTNLPAACTIDQTTREVTCGLGTVAANQNRLVRVFGTLDGEARDELTALGTVASETFDRNLANDTTALETSVQPELSLVLTVTDSPDPVVAGNRLTYTLNVINQGPSTATDIEVRDTFPATFLTPTLVPAPGCVLNGNSLSCDYDSLLPSAGHLITVTGYVDSFARTTVTNVATVESNEYPLDSSTEVTNILANVALTSATTIAPTPIEAGRDITFTVVISNSGPSGATGIVAQTTVPTDITGLTVSPTVSCPAPTSNVVTCNFPTLAPNTTRTYTIKGNVAANARGNRQIASTIDATEIVLPLITSQPFTITANVDLDLTLTSNPENPVAGEELIYAFTVINNGPSTATDVRVEDRYALPFDLTAIDPGCQPSGTRTVTCRISALAPTASTTFTLTGMIDAGTTGALTNTVSAFSNEITVPITASLSPQVVANVDLDVTPVVQPATLVAGESVTYTLTVINAGPSNATDVVLTGTLTDLISPTVEGACNLNDEEYECHFGTLEPNDPQIVVASGIIPPTQRGDLNHAVYISSDEQPTPQVIPLEGEITADVRLSFLLTANPTGDVIAGQPIEYTLSAANSGPSTALNVSFTDTFESLLTPTASLGCTLNLETFTCPVAGGIGINETAVITVSGYVSPETTGTIINTGALIWAEPEIGRTYSDSIPSNVLADIDFDIDLSPPPATTLIAGEAVIYTVGVTNTGDSVAPGVVVTGTLNNLLSPAVTIVGGSACSINSSVYTCNLADLAPQTGSKSVRINGTVLPTYRGPLSNTVTISTAITTTSSVNRFFSNTVSDDVVLDIDTVVAPPTPSAGQNITYTFGITNTGDSTALNVVVEDTLTKVLTATISYRLTNAPGGTCSRVNFTVTCNLGSLPKGQVSRVEIFARVNPAARTSIENEYVVRSTDIANILGTLNRELNANTILNLNVTGKSTVTAGLPLSYTVALTNTGPSTATSTRITGTLNSLIAVTENSPNCTIVSGTLLDCTVPTLSVGGTFNVQVNGTVNPTTRDPILNNFRADAAESAPVLDDVPTSVTRNVNFAINMGALPNTTVIAGEDLRYNVTITNTGNSAALGTVITATTISLLTPTLTITPGGTCTLNSSEIIVCNVGEVAPNATFQLVYTGTVDPAMRGDFINSTGVTEIDQPTALVTNRKIRANAQANLVLSVVPSSPVVPGSSMTYNITLTNSGPSTATNAEITGTLNVIQNETGGVGCDISTGSAFTCTLGTLLPNVPFITTISGDVPGTSRGSLLNTFRATSTEDVNSSVSIPAPLVPDVNLGISLSATGVVTPSAQMTYTAVFTNSGVSTALTSVLTYTYTHLTAAPDYDIISGVTGNCTSNHAAQRMVCTFDNSLTGDTTGSVRFVGTLSSTLPTTITHTATIAASNPTSSATDSVQVTRNRSYPLYMDIRATGVVTNSSPLTYTILVANGSDNAIANVVLTDSYSNIFNAPPTVTEPSGASCVLNHGPRQVVCTFATIPPQSESLVMVKGTLDNSLPTNVVNNATLRSPTPPITLTDSLSLPSNSSTPMQLKITATGTVTPSQNITYTLHITNVGAISIPNVVVTDTYSTHFTTITVASVLSGPTGVCNLAHASQRVVCSFASFPSGASAKIRIVGKLAGSGLPTTITNNATLRITSPNLTVNYTLPLTVGNSYPLAIWFTQNTPWGMVLLPTLPPFLSKWRKRRRSYQKSNN